MNPGAPRPSLKPLIVGALSVSALLAILYGARAWLQGEPLQYQIADDWAALSDSVVEDPQLKLTQVAQGFNEPTDIQFIPGTANVAVVLEKRGRARLWRPSNARLSESAPSEGVPQPGAELFRIAVQRGSEMGLLGLAFHPKFMENGLFYLNYIPEQGERRTRIAEWKIATPEAPSHAEEQRVLLEVNQPYSNHNGGALLFGTDGMLYIALGDGGHRADPQGNGQNPQSLLGKILRIDPSPEGQAAYSIPQDNPFVNNPKFRPEIWALGLRNPWRFSFTAQGTVLAGDVGQDHFEEVDLIAAGDNLGWNVREAGHCFLPAEACSNQGFIDPIFEYGRTLGSSVTGGMVYRGSALANLIGKYIFGDFSSGRLWAIPVPSEPGGAYQLAEPLGKWPLHFSTFAQTAEGELYVADFARGGIYQLQPL